MNRREFTKRFSLLASAIGLSPILPFDLIPEPRIEMSNRIMTFSPNNMELIELMKHINKTDEWTATRIGWE